MSNNISLKREPRVQSILGIDVLHHMCTALKAGLHSVLLTGPSSNSLPPPQPDQLSYSLSFSGNAFNPTNLNVTSFTVSSPIV